MKKREIAGLGQMSSVLRTVRAACEYRPEEMASTPRLSAEGALLDTVPN